MVKDIISELVAEVTINDETWRLLKLGSSFHFFKDMIYLEELTLDDQRFVHMRRKNTLSKDMQQWVVNVIDKIINQPKRI